MAQGFAAGGPIGSDPAAPNKDVPELNNNRGNNRRRGRGNNRPQGGGQQLNRIDSRARGNAPQLLEKYRKLAQDAHLNGDRVQAEYYLQFADHYFRVIADTRLRQEEQRMRSNERWQDQEGEADESSEFGVDGDFAMYPQPGQPSAQHQGQSGQQSYRQREEREPREQREPREYNREPREYRDNRDQREGYQQRGRPRRDREVERTGETGEPVAGLTPGVEGEPLMESPSDNPFVRDNRAARGLRARTAGPRGTERRPRRHEAEGEMLGLDPSSLPPSIGARSEPQDFEPAGEAPAAPAPAPAPVAEAAAEAPAPRKRGRPRKNPLPEAGDTPATVNG